MRKASRLTTLLGAGVLACGTPQETPRKEFSEGPFVPVSFYPDRHPTRRLEMPRAGENVFGEIVSGGNYLSAKAYDVKRDRLGNPLLHEHLGYVSLILLDVREMGTVTALEVSGVSREVAQELLEGMIAYSDEKGFGIDSSEASFLREHLPSNFKN